jgi:hypothetical protein
LLRRQVLDQQQGRAEVAQPGEHPEQCRLIDQRADQFGRAVIGLDNGEAVEPGGPGRLEVVPVRDQVVLCAASWW